jgi:transposase
VLDETGSIVAKRRVVPTVESFTELERAALAGAPEGVTLELVIEPTGPAWLPVAVWFVGRGHTVFRVSTQKAADLRRFLSRHAKSNSIDGHTLARLPMIDPAGLKSVALPATAQRAQLDRRVRDLGAADPRDRRTQGPHHRAVPPADAHHQAGVVREALAR